MRKLYDKRSLQSQHRRSFPVFISFLSFPFPLAIPYYIVCESQQKIQIRNDSYPTKSFLRLQKVQKGFPSRFPFSRDVLVRCEMKINKKGLFQWSRCQMSSRARRGNNSLNMIKAHTSYLSILFPIPHFLVSRLSWHHPERRKLTFLRPVCQFPTAKPSFGQITPSAFYTMFCTHAKMPMLQN